MRFQRFAVMCPACILMSLAFGSYGGYVTEDFVVFAHKVQTSVDTVPATHLTTLA